MSAETLGMMMKRELALHPDAVVGILNQIADALSQGGPELAQQVTLTSDSVLLERHTDGSLKASIAPGHDERRVNASFEDTAYASAFLALAALTGEDTAAASDPVSATADDAQSVSDDLIETARQLRCPAGFIDVFSRALSPEQSARFGTVREFAHAFEEAVDSLAASQLAAFYRRALEKKLADVSISVVDSAEASTGTVAEAGAGSSGKPGASTGKARGHAGKEAPGNLRAHESGSESNADTITTTTNRVSHGGEPLPPGVADDADDKDSAEDAISSSIVADAGSEAVDSTSFVPPDGIPDSAEDDFVAGEDEADQRQSRVGGAIAALIGAIQGMGVTAVVVLSASFVAGLVGWGFFSVS